MPNARMVLRSFRVMDFRSINDSGWIDTEQITTLIGVNESGKSNLLQALWKLKPAKEGVIDPIADYPRRRYNEIRQLEEDEKPVFVEAIFELAPSLSSKVAEMSGYPEEDIRRVHIQRRYDGEYLIAFPDARRPVSVSASDLSRLEALHSQLGALQVERQGDQLVLQAVSASLDRCAELISQSEAVDLEVCRNLQELLDAVSTEKAPKNSIVVPLLQNAKEVVADWIENLRRPLPHESASIGSLILREMPSFVYYSQYGNLDSEIYLPHVIDNLRRDDLSPTAAAKARTLRVLFNFVGLNPKEILELGRDFEKRDAHGRPVQPTEEELGQIAEAKKEREILLQSASVKLTDEFRNWWKQGEYRFRFQADGDHFRIWVSDDKRPEEVELEARSTGLQWFLSFYLVFLVESEESHAGTIILLDEAGLSLHALAQRNLLAFFESLSEANQLIHSTHSPFLVDASHLDRVVAIYVDESGRTVATSDLRSAAPSDVRHKSVYAVHAALGLAVSDALVQGCLPTVVEGESDQFFLSGVKHYLVGKGLLKPARELLFFPAYGVKGVKHLASILSGKEERLPVVLVDSDAAGRELKKALLSDLYVGSQERVLEVQDFRGLKDAEVEDLMPLEMVLRYLDRFVFRSATRDFSDFHNPIGALVPQVEAFAAEEGIVLERGWKVDMAQSVKARLLEGAEVDSGLLETWKEIFERIVNPSKPTA